jgi:Ni/Co efflux regulator RcnB
MKTRTTISIFAAIALALVGSSAFAQHRQQQQQDFDRDRMRQRDRTFDSAQDRDRDRDQDRVHAPDEAGNGNQKIYGSELMSVEERNQFREQLRLAESDPEAKARLMEQHREQMQIRAKEQGVKIDEPD